MSAAAPAQAMPPPPPPPAMTVGLVGWLRANLFSSRVNSALTVVLGAVLLWALVSLVGWLLFAADWAVVTTRTPLYLVGLYPAAEYWRPQAALLLVCLLLGVTWGRWGRAARGFALGLGVVLLVVGLLPHGMQPLNRALLLLNTAALGLGYLLTARLTLGRLPVFRRVAAALHARAARLYLRRPNRLPPAAWLTVQASRLLNAGAVGLGYLLTAWLALERRPWVRRAAAMQNALAARLALGRPKRLAALAIVSVIAALLLIRGIEGVPGLTPVNTQDIGGLLLNLLLALFGIVMSMPLGIALALGRRSNLPVVKMVCVGFIELVRGVPLITLLFMSRHILPLTFPANIHVDALYLSAITITLFSSAYMAENVRGGMAAVSEGQVEAARALGLRGWQTTLLVTLPQGLRNIIPAIVGQSISLFKDTSLVFIIGMLDLVEMGRVTIQGNQEFLDNGREVYVFIALVFWVFTFSMSFVSRRIERALGVGRR